MPDDQLTHGHLLWGRSKMVIELHEGYIQLGGSTVGEGFVRALVELADRIFPTGWRTVDGFVVPSKMDEAPSRACQWLTELDYEREAKGLNRDGTKKKKKKAAPKKKPKAAVKKIPVAKRKLKRNSNKKGISLKRRRK